MPSIEIKDEWKDIISRILDPSSISHIELIHTGGSDRKFYRVQAGEKSCILQETGNREEFRDYIAIGSFLFDRGIKVPKMLTVDNERCIALFEDAGRTDLQSLVLPLPAEPGLSKIIELYRKVIVELVRLQEFSPAELPEAITSRRFDIDYYRWETDYFIENCIGVYFGMTDFPEKEIREELIQLAKSLETEPLFPVHRDFQSQNIYLKDGQVYFLDFQSARLGSMFYDTASLLRDPYVELPEKARDDLFLYYFNRVKEKGLRQDIEYEEALNIYHRVSLQRLMQALGAYGNLGINKGKKAFLQHIPPAARLLRNCLSKMDDYPCLEGLVEEINIRLMKEQEEKKQDIRKCHSEVSNESDHQPG